MKVSPGCYAHFLSFVVARYVPGEFGKRTGIWLRVSGPLRGMHVFRETL